jgi:hypothetical protein
LQRLTLAEHHQWPSEILGEPVGEKRSGEKGEEHQCSETPVLVCLHRPAATDGGERRDAREGGGHAKEQRQARSHERLVNAGEYEGQHWQDTRTEDGENTRQIRQNQKSHVAFLSM